MLNAISKQFDRAEGAFFRKTGLTEAQAFLLFKAAVKDNKTLIDDIIQRLYVEMKAFDGERTDDAIELIVDRSEGAASRLQALLDEMLPAYRPQLA